MTFNTNSKGCELNNVCAVCFRVNKWTAHDDVIILTYCIITTALAKLWREKKTTIKSLKQAGFFIYWHQWWLVSRLTCIWEHCDTFKTKKEGNEFTKRLNNMSPNTGHKACERLNKTIRRSQIRPILNFWALKLSAVSGKLTDLITLRTRHCVWRESE